MTIVGYLIDEVVSALHRNSVSGPPPEHWFPPLHVREQLHLAEHTCMWCKAVDPKHRRITVPHCIGRPQ